jgi:sphingolipid delta-4 desaturase
MAEPLQFDVVDYPEPHLERTRKLLKAHPEVRSLFGHTRSTALFVFAVVAVQVAAAWAMRASPWWQIVAAAWLFGAFADHALWTLIHECTHNLVFKRPRNNALLQIFANLPIVFPAAISFRKFHLLHHRFQGDPALDADLASPFEAKLIGNSTLGKALWELTFFAWQASRVTRFKHVKFFDGWYLLNLASQLAFLAGLWAWAGWHAVFYVTMSSVFAIGLHPLGARWIQEHFLTSEGQETWSYYGPLNTVAFNVGYHNEHHDLMMVPWSRLPKLKAMAPEFYDGLVSHRSWTKLWLRFLFDPKLSLYSRRIRYSREQAPQADAAFTDAIATEALKQADAA